MYYVFVDETEFEKVYKILINQMFPSVDKCTLIAF